MVLVLAAVVVALAATAAVLSLTLTSSPTATNGKRTAAVPRIIIDSDLSRWWDDATAIGLANILEQRGSVRILGIMSDIPNPVAVAAIDAIDSAYGHSRIPLGAVVDSVADTAPHGYSDDLADKLPHSVRSSRDVPGAVDLYRHLLAAQPNHSVTIVAIGAYTNLAGLLRSAPGQGSPLGGRALVQEKVRRLVVEDGLFPNGAPAVTNQKLDLASAGDVVEGTNWPTPIAWVDGFVGIRTKVGGALCTSVKADNPMRIAYQWEFGCKPPGDGDWDGPTLLYAIGGKGQTFSELGQGGAAYVNPQGGLSWRIDPSRPHDLYVHVVDQQALNRRIDALLGAS